jgi:hypothetical protein
MSWSSCCRCVSFMGYPLWNDRFRAYIYIMLLFILIRYVNIISECLQYFTYPFHKEYLDKLTHLRHQHQGIKRFYYNFNLFHLITIYVLHKYWCALPEDNPQDRAETCRSSSVLSVKTLHCNTVHLLVYSWIVLHISLYRPRRMLGFVTW